MPGPNKRARDIERKYSSGNFKRNLNNLKQTVKAKQYGALDKHLSKTNQNTSKEAGPSSEEYMELKEIVTKSQEPIVGRIKTDQTDEESSNGDDEEINVDFEMLQLNDTTYQPMSQLLSLMMQLISPMTQLIRAKNIKIFPALQDRKM